VATVPIKKFDNIRLDTINERDRRTDRETDRHRATAKTAIIRIMSRGNKMYKSVFKSERRHSVTDMLQL